MKSEKNKIRNLLHNEIVKILKEESLTLLPTAQEIQNFYDDIEKMGQHKTMSKYKDNGWDDNLIDSLFQAYATNETPKEAIELRQKINKNEITEAIRLNDTVAVYNF